MSSDPSVPSSGPAGSPACGADVQAVGRADLDETARITSCDAAGRDLLGLPEAEDGEPAFPEPPALTDVFTHDGAAWLEQALRLGVGLDERPVRTRAGRVVRIQPEAAGRILILDDAGRSAVEESTSLARCDRARAQLAAAVARDLNDSMSVVQGRLELLLELGDAEGSGRNARHLEVALGHARRVSATLHLLRMVGRPPPFALSPVAVRDVVVRAVDGLPGTPPTVVLEPPDLHVATDDELLERIVRGLVGRLTEAAHRGLEARIHAFEEGERVRIDLLAVPPEATPELSRATAAPTDPRVDVGVAALVLERVSGRLTGLRLGRGLVFRLELPAAGGPSRTSLSDLDVLVMGPSSPVVCRLLEAQGAVVHTPPDVEAALAALADGLGRSGLIVDQDLPSVSGLGFVREAIRRWPRLRRRAVLVSRHRPDGLLAGIAWCRLPLSRDALLHGLGRSGGAR